MKPSLLFVSFLICLLPATAGCSTRAEAPGPITRQTATTDPPVFEMQVEPAENEELTDGRFLITGQLVADAGLAESEALILEVVDNDTGLLSRLDVSTLLTDPVVVLDVSSFDTGSGEFVLGGEDFAIDAGNKRIRLYGKDAENRVCVWSQDVVALPYWETSSEMLGRARSDLQGQMLAAVQVYRATIDELSFEAPFGSDQIELDKAYLDLLIDYLDARTEDTAGSQLLAVGQAFEDEVEALIGQLAPSQVQAENNYREGLVNSTGWERHSAELSQNLAAGGQLLAFPPPANWPYRAQQLAYLSSTFVGTDWTMDTPNPTETMGQFTFVIFQDTGSPAGRWQLRMPAWDPEELEPNTADPAVAMVSIEVEFLDTDDDDLVDEIEVRGEEYNPIEEEFEELGETQTYGHVVTPLQHLFLSSWYAPDQF